LNLSKDEINRIASSIEKEKDSPGSRENSGRTGGKIRTLKLSGIYLVK